VLANLGELSTASAGHDNAGRSDNNAEQRDSLADLSVATEVKHRDANHTDLVKSDSFFPVTNLLV
jgi:hypothetical protein